MPRELSPVLREALAWVIRLHSGAATSDDAAALDLWRRSSTEHEAAFREAIRLWRAFGEGARKLVAEKQRDASADAARRLDRTAISRRALIGGAMAASVAAGYVAVRPPLGLWPSLREITADYRTAKGEQRKVALAEDVALTLNTQTSIAIRSSATEPRIELIAGEAAIVARRAAAAPLVIEAAGARITAARASFDVRCLDGAVSVSCIDGTVEVAAAGRSVAIQKEQQVAYSTGEGLGMAAAADLAETRAWQDGLLIVRNWPVSRVVDEINRYRAGKIIVMDSTLAQRMISGSFYLNRLDDFIGQARSLFGASVRALPGGVVLLS